MKIILMTYFPYSMRIFDRHVGLFQTIRGTPIKINKKGMCDNWGILTCFVPHSDIPVPIHLEIETKTGKGTLGGAQKDWRKFCLTMGVWHFVYRSNKMIVDEIKDRAEKCSLRIANNEFDLLSKSQK